MIQQIFGPDKEDPIDSDFENNIEDNLLVTLSFSEPTLPLRRKERISRRPKSSLTVKSIKPSLTPNHNGTSHKAEFRTKSAPNLKHFKEDSFHVSLEESKCADDVVYANKDFETSSGSDDVFENDYVSVEDNIQIWENQNISDDLESRSDYDPDKHDKNILSDLEKRGEKDPETDVHSGCCDKNITSDADLHFPINMPGAIIPTTLSEEDSKSSRAPSRTTIIDEDSSSRKRKSWWTIMLFCLSRN